MSTESGSASPLGEAGLFVTLPPEPRSARSARRFITDALRGEDTEQWELAAKLLVTELVTNAILHARTEITVRLALEDDGPRILVSDRSPRMPSPRSYSSDATTGRGLALVERLSSDWGIEAHEGGKTVWAKLGTIDWEALLEVEELGEPATPAAIAFGPSAAGPTSSGAPESGREGGAAPGAARATHLKAAHANLVRQSA